MQGCWFHNTLLWFTTSFCSLYSNKCGLWHFKTHLTYFINVGPVLLLRGNQEIIKHLTGMWFTTLLYCFSCNKCLCCPHSKHVSSLGFCDHFRGGWKVLSWQLWAYAYFLGINCTLKKKTHISLENDLSRTERMTEVTDRVKACVSDMGFICTLKLLYWIQTSSFSQTHFRRLWHFL